MKGVHSSKNLTYWDAVLDVVVSSNVRRNCAAISRVLKTRPYNILKASARKSSIMSFGSSQFSLPKRKKSFDVLDLYVVQKTEEWWLNEI